MLTTLFRFLFSAPEVVSWLMRDFGLKDFQAAGIVGNVPNSYLPNGVMDYRDIDTTISSATGLNVCCGLHNATTKG